MISDMTRGKLYCNCLAQQRGLDPAGHASAFDDAVIVEVPLPWKADMTQQAGALPQPVIDLLARWLQQYYAGEGYPHLLLAVAPDPAYSQEGCRRVMFYSRPAGPFSQFDKIEYLVPVDQVGPLVWARDEARDDLPRFEPYRVPAADRVRDILVCTHGTIDAACAKFGYPLYKHMADTYSNEHLRVWRVSHFGGHVFAPTLMDMPTGHYWAYVGREQAAQIVQREGDIAGLRGHYRGWAGMSSGFLQAAECHLWQQHGWDWFDYHKAGEIVAQDSNPTPQWAGVNIRYRLPGERSETTARLRVEISRRVDTEHSTNSDAIYPYPQYHVVPP